MFCPECGQKAADAARFCSRCGRQFSMPAAADAAAPAQAAAGLPLPLAINLNISLIKTAPHIFWLDLVQCGFIRIDPGLYEQITRLGPREADKAQAFRNYAASLRSQAFEALIAACPGSIRIDAAQIQSLRIHKYYDADFHRYMDYARFTLITSAGKYRGSFTRDADLSSFEPQLQSLLGSRCSSHEIVHGFDDD